MAETGRSVRRTNTGNITGADAGGTCLGGTLTPGSDDCSVVFRENGSGGTVLFTVKALALVGTVSIPGPFRFEGQLHATVSGTNPEVMVLI
jgi:hypothetical protein